MNNAFDTILARESLAMYNEATMDDSLDESMDILMNIDELEEDANE